MKSVPITNTYVLELIYLVFCGTPIQSFLASTGCVGHKHC